MMACYTINAKEKDSLMQVKMNMALRTLTSRGLYPSTSVPVAQIVSLTTLRRCFFF